VDNTSIAPTAMRFGVLPERAAAIGIVPGIVRKIRSPTALVSIDRTLTLVLQRVPGMQSMRSILCQLS
jgi:hypothetical protein